MKLAVVGKVIETQAIPGADRIQQATVVCGDAGKWSGVVGKDIAVDQLVTVFLPDALLPPDPRWGFMEARGWRVRMCRFKGCPSECLILGGCDDLPIGTDLTLALGVTKYEKSINLPSGDQKCAFPGWVPKTDEPNFQTLYREDIFAKLQTEKWTATLKYDGTSATAWVDEEGLHVCSRNWEIKEGGNLYWEMARKYTLQNLPHHTVVQFEIVGPGIQGNPLSLGQKEIRVFSLRKDRRWDQRSREELLEVCAEHNLPVAQHVESATPPRSADELRKAAEVLYPNGKPAEGLVFRADGGFWSFKVINLKYGG